MSFLENIVSNMKMPLGETLLVSLIGLITVIIVLAFIAVLIILISKAIRTVEDAANKSKTGSQPATAPSAVPMPAGMNQGELELINTDEKTAAVIMAIVSDKSGIPLNRLSFRSIRLMEDEK